MKLSDGRVYECEQCGWRGDDPAISDPTELNDAGELTYRHFALCPKCFSDRLKARSGEQR